MTERQKVVLPQALSVDSINSLYRFDLSTLSARGDIHDFYEIIYVERGELVVRVDGVLHRVPSGGLLVYAPNSYHVGEEGTVSTAVVDIISFDSRSPMMGWFDNRVFPLSEGEQGVWREVFERAERVLLPRAGGVELRPGSTLCELQLLKNRLESFLLSLYREEEPPLTEASNRRAYKKERFLRFSSYLKEHLGEPLTLSEMAAASSLSISAVKALCREFCGCGPNEYLLSLRTARAKVLIRESSLNFTEIAAATGFGSLHYFSRVFKARTGKTPTAYAKAPYQ